MNNEDYLAAAALLAHQLNEDNKEDLDKEEEDDENEDDE